MVFLFLCQRLFMLWWNNQLNDITTNHESIICWLTEWSYWPAGPLFFFFYVSVQLLGLGMLSNQRYFGGVNLLVTCLTSSDFFAGFSLTLYHLNARLVVQLALWFIKTRFLSSHQLLADYCFLLLFFQEFLLFFRWFALACSSNKRAKPLAPEAARVWHRKIRKRACKNCSMKLVYPNELFKTNPASLPSVPKNQRYWDIVAGSHTLIC